MQDETKSAIADIAPPGCSFFHEPRADQRAGRGVGILVSDELKTDIHPLPSFKTFEAISALSETIYLVVSLSVCFGFKTVHGNFFMNFNIY